MIGWYGPMAACVSGDVGSTGFWFVREAAEVLGGQEREEKTGTGLFWSIRRWEQCFRHIFNKRLSDWAKKGSVKLKVDWSDYPKHQGLCEHHWSWSL